MVDEPRDKEEGEATNAALFNGRNVDPDGALIVYIIDPELRSLMVTTPVIGFEKDKSENLVMIISG